MRTRKRVYLLDGKPCSPALGMKHVARSDRGPCMSCHQEVKKGQTYILLNVWGADPIHEDCWIGDHPDGSIIGVRVDYIPSGLFNNGSRVICEWLTGELET